jgi:hypothetical protein
VPYFHLVFTLPHAVNALAQGNPRTIYRLLFETVSVRIPAKLTDKSDDDDRVVSCSAWRSDFSAVGHHRCQFPVLESRCTTAGQPGSPANAWTEVTGHWVAPV